MQKLVVANWKQNKNVQEVSEWLEVFATLLLKNPLTNVEITIAPSFVHLPIVQQFANQYENVSVAAQDVSEFEEGSHTGQVGANQLKEFCKYCIVGHSETNTSFEQTFQKGLRCCAVHLVPIVCLSQVPTQMPECPGKAVFALEDPDNISKNGVYNSKAATDIEETLKSFESVLPSEEIVLYGGSVNRDNANTIANIFGISGALVGNASLDPQHFFELCAAFN